MRDLSAFEKVIQQMIELFDRMIPLEQSKLEAVSKNKIAVLEDIIKKEQAEIMSLRGLDQKRERTQEELGWKDLTFQQILKEAPEEQSKLQELFDELAGRVKTFQSVTESSKTMMEVNLHAINQVIAQQAGGTQTYKEDGSVEAGTSHFTDRRI
ncbi:MAG: flagellar protein FlgN [Lachnospiraceae bacterium]|jgi:flagellar biosynthesis/type III secretory pathway chaperone|uniref:flagellar protein FlgN n=1 Tax=Candidatus Merdisoma sp. JLR.KK006 TaxID=3112626 RepID=UPI002FEF96BF|nr:flagellar protein FlgN [Lachnospiraceae bacterium]